MLLEKRNIRTHLYKGRFEDGVFLLVDAVLEGRALFRNKFRSVFNENVCKRTFYAQLLSF